MDPAGLLSFQFLGRDAVPHWRQWGGGGLVVDWDFRTNLEGLYAAGGAIYGGGAHSSAATSGRYAGRKAASYAVTAPEPQHRPRAGGKRKGPRLRSAGTKQTEHRLERTQRRDLQGHAGLLRPIQERRNTSSGVEVAPELWESRRQPCTPPIHTSLARAVECGSIITVGEAVIHASLARKAE